MQDQQRSMQVSVIRPALRRTAFVGAVGASLSIAPRIPAQVIVPAAIASSAPAQVTAGAPADVDRLIVTGSNILTGDEVAPHTVATSGPADLEREGIPNAPDLA